MPSGLLGFGLKYNLGPPILFNLQFWSLHFSILKIEIWFILGNPQFWSNPQFCLCFRSNSRPKIFS